MTNDPSPPPAATLTRALTLLMIVLMLAAMIYAGWIAAINWSHISV